MNTKKLLTILKKQFNVSTYWLEHFLKISHANMFRYINGLNEAKFDDVQKWLKLLGIVVINDSLYLTMGTHISTKPIQLLNKEVVAGHLDAMLDSIQWNEEDKEIERKEGHKVWYLTESQLREFKEGSR